MDKQTFQDLLDSNNLKRIPIYYKNSFVGYVTRDLKYQNIALQAHRVLPVSLCI